MPVPVQVQHIKALTGTNEGVDFLSLAETLSSGGSENIYIDEWGRIRSILGYEAMANTTGLGGAGNRAAVGLHTYRLSGERHLLAEVIRTSDYDTQGIYYNKQGDDINAWTAGYSPAPPTITRTGYWPFDSARFGDRLYFCNNTLESAPLYWEGGSILSSLSFTDLSPTPTATPGSADQGRLNGVYKVKLLSKYADGTGKYASAYDEFTADHATCAYSWTADADTDVIGYEVYRTTTDSNVFYLVEYVDGRTTAAYTDNTPDDILSSGGRKVLEAHGEVPPNAMTFLAVFKQRMWYAREDTEAKDRTFWLYWSDPGDPESVWDQNFLKFDDGPNRDDPAVGITGIYGDYKDSLVVFTEGSIWRVSGTGRIVNRVPDWDRELTNAQVGTIAKKSVVKVPRGAKFQNERGEVMETATETLAYFTPLGDIRLFDGDADVVISLPMKDTLARWNPNKEHAHRTTACHDRVRQQIIWTYTVLGQSSPTESVVWNYRFGTWFYWPNTPFYDIHESTHGNNPSVLYAAGNDGSSAEIYKYFTGTSFDGSEITSKWVSKPLYGYREEEERVQEAVSNRKRWRWVDLILDVDDRSERPVISWTPGLSEGDTEFNHTETMVLGSTRLFTSSGEAVMTTADAPISQSEPILVRDNVGIFRIRLKESDGRHTHSEFMRLGLSFGSALGGWKLSGLALAYQILPGLKRRNQ